MPSKSYRIKLDSQTWLVIDYVMVKGRIVSFVVRLMTTIEDNDVSVARYDTAHGMPHRDELDLKSEVVTKIWLPQLTLENAMTFGIEDFRKHYENYIHKYLSASRTNR
jgi:hypothetical protein